MSPPRRRAVALLAALLTALPLGGACLGADPPRLVLFVTIDQFRGDVLSRFEERFDEGGFRLLLDRGVHYTNAHFRHSTTFTAVGHATLFTGGNPPEHGIVANDWQTPDGRRVYCVEDEAHVVLGEPSRAHRGTSPRNLKGSTIGDQLVVASGGRSRVYSVSVKDRGAILPAGHLGKAFWYSSDSGRFVTSTYYFDKMPAWAEAWHARDPVGAYAGTAWALLRDRSDYRSGDRDDRAYETAYGNLGRVFPHPLEDTENAPLARSIAFTPFGDELTLSFVRTLVEHEGVGRSGATDLLAVSFSSSDYVGHAFGPHSLEWEDTLFRLDRTIAGLLSLIDEHVGLERTLVVLSSDHGIDAAPEHRHELACGESIPVTSRAPRCGGAGRHVPAELIAAANRTLRESFGVEAALVTAFWNPALYLDVPAIARLGLDVAAVERALADAMAETPGIARAYARTDLLVGRVGDDPVARRVRRAFHPRRSGNVLLVQEPFWYLHHRPLPYSAMHGSPYAYDTHVPIVIVAPRVPPGVVHRRVGPEDIAPTLAMLLGVGPPSGSVGEPLEEVLGPRPGGIP